MCLLKYLLVVKINGKTLRRSYKDKSENGDGNLYYASLTAVVAAADDDDDDDDDA